jgi:hypothetical protein
VHALYAWRIYKLISRRWWAITLSTLVVLLSMAQFACCFGAAMFNALQEFQGPDKQYVARHLFRAWLILATTADVIITTVMTIKLYSARTGIRSTDRAITKLLYVTIPGGAIVRDGASSDTVRGEQGSGSHFHSLVCSLFPLRIKTTFVTMMILLVQVKMEGSNDYQILIICLTKFYSNSVLLCLNLRASNVSGLGRHTMLSGFHTTDHQFSSSRIPFEVKVERKTEIGTSSGGMVSSSLFHSDPARTSSCEDFGMEKVRANVAASENVL